MLSPRPLLRGVAGFAGVLFCLLALLGPARETDTLPGFLHEALGPPQAAAPLLHHPADGVRVAIKPDHFTVVRGAASVSLAAEGIGNTEWRHFENGATRITPFGAETVVVDGDKAEQYLTVTERQGLTTWRWKITADGLEPRLTPMGGVELLRNGERSGLHILPARIYGPSGRDVTPSGVHWSLTGTTGSRWLELRLDDANLPLPYVIDPAVDYPSPLYLSNTASTVSGSWQLTGAPGLLGDSSTRGSLCKNCVGYVQWKPGVDNGVSAAPTSAPTGHGWIVDAAGGNGFAAGDWSFTVETDIPDLLLVAGDAILAVGVWKGTISGAVFSPTETLLPPTDDPAAQNLRTSVLPVTTTVTYSLPSFSLADGETLYVEYWRKQVVGINETNLTRRYLDFIVNDGVAKIVHATADSTPPERPVLTLSESEPDEHVAGTMLYYNPSGTNTGTFTVDASTGDAESGVSLVEFPAVFGLDSAIDPLAPYQTSYSWTASATANGDHTVTAINGASLETASTFTVSPDTAAPTVSLTQPAAGAPIRDGQTLAAAADDSLAGIREVEFGYCPGTTCSWLIATPLGTDVTAPYSLTWNDLLADGEYTLLAAATDNVGNGAASLGVTVTVDNTAPSNSLTVVEGSRADLEYFDDATTTLYYNPVATGGFRLEAAPSDATGIAMVEFPSVSTSGFTGAAASDGLAPYESNSYSFGAANAAAPAPAAVVVTDLARNTASTSLSFVRDTDPPSGGDVTYLDGYDADGAVAIATADGTDAAAGVDPDSRLLERQTAPLADGSCGAFGGWTSASSPDAVPSGSCARYRHTVADRVGNAATFTSSNVVKVDLSAPVAPILTLSESEPDEHVDGTTLYYNPSGANTGTFVVAAATSDSESAVVSVSFAAVFGLDEATAASAPYAAGYSWTAGATASGPSTVTATNAAGLTATASFTVTPDTTGPDVVISAPADGGAVREGDAVEAAAFDTLAGAAEVQFRFCAGGACAWDTATPLGTDTAPPYSLAWNTQPADGTYTLVARAVDNVGNLADAAAVTVTVDNTDPSNFVFPMESFSPDLQHYEDSTDTLYYNPEASGGFVLSSAADDAGSGVARVDFPRISVTGFRGAAASDGLAPFTSNTYSFDDANAIAPSDAMIVVTDVAGNSTSETISFERDTAPPTGGFVSYADGYQATASVSIETASGTDAGVGIDAASAVLERQTTVLESGVCGAYGPWEPAVGPDSLPDATCARYRHRVSDQVGNEAVYSSADVVQTDFTPPTAELLDPGASLRGTVDLAANASDGASGLASLTYQVSPVEANQWTDVAASWDTTSVADGLYDLRVVVTDRAGNGTVSAAVEGRRVDNTAPGVEITAPVGYVNAGAADPYPVTAASPDGDVASIEFFRCDDASADCATGGWTSLGVDASAPFAASWNLDADGNRALKAVALDAVGNAAGSVVNVVIDREAPGNGSLSISHTTSTWSSDSTVDVAFAAPTDAGSGADGFSYHWDLDPAGTPDASKDAEETAGGTTSPPLADGAWYFHLRTVDKAGNWSEPVHAGPFLVDLTAPTPVAVGGWALLQRFILTPTFTVSWTGGDAASGTSSYDIQYRSAGYKGVFGAPVLWQSAVTATSASFTGSPGSTYCFSARALDAVGNLSTWSAERCTALPLNNTSLAHSTGWSKLAARGYYLKSYSVSSRQGASLTRTGVVAKRIAVVVTKCATCGTLGVYWNGTLLKKLNLAASTTAKKQLITVAGWASPRSGTVKLVVLSSGRPVIVEGLGVRVP